MTPSDRTATDFDNPRGRGMCVCGVETVNVGDRTYPALNPACPVHAPAAQEHADVVRDWTTAYDMLARSVGPLNADHPLTVMGDLFDALLALLAEAQQEAGLILVALAEPCAECGHVDWRADDARIDSYRNALATAKSERDEAYRQAAQADEANVMMGDRCRDVEIALATAEVLADRRLEALRQASDCCSRPPGVCFDSALARLSAGKEAT